MRDPGNEVAFMTALYLGPSTKALHNVLNIGLNYGRHGNILCHA